MRSSFALSIVFAIQGIFQVTAGLQHGPNETELVQYIQNKWYKIVSEYDVKLSNLDDAILKIAQDTSNNFRQDLFDEFHLLFPQNYTHFSQDFQRDMIKQIASNVKSSKCMEIVQIPSRFVRGALNWGNITLEPVFRTGRFCAENQMKCNPTDRFNELNETLTTMSQEGFRNSPMSLNVCFNGTRLGLIFVLSTFNFTMEPDESIKTYQDFLQRFDLNPMSLEKLEAYDRRIYETHPQTWYKGYMYMEKWCQRRISPVTRRPMKFTYFSPLMMMCQHVG